MKIKNKIILKIFNMCTGKEIDFLFYIGQLQDDNGYIRGVYYQDVIKDLNISKTTFYNVIESLGSKKIIEVDYRNSSYSLWNFKIIDNLFVTKKQFKEGYLNLNHEVIHSYNFKKLPKTAKIIAIRFIMRNQNGRHNISVMFEDLMDWTSKTKQSVINSLRLLSNLFNMIIYKNRVEVCVDECFFKRNKREKDIFNEHSVKRILIEMGFEDRRSCNPDEIILKDTCKVIQQYNKLPQEKIFNVIRDSLKYTGGLAPRYINTILSKIYKAVKKKREKTV